MCHERKISTTNLESYAKVNFGLKVIFRYPNGYHHINSLFLPISFSDTIIFSKKKIINQKFQHNSLLSIKWKDELNHYYSKQLSPYFSKKLQHENILVKSFHWFLKWIDTQVIQNKLISQENQRIIIAKVSSICLNIIKRVPSPAGLGGGSSNAAIYIQYLFINILEEINSNDIRKKLKKLIEKDVMELGADIAFFFSNKPSLVTGVGTIKKRYNFPKIYGILGIPPFLFSTSRVYKHLNSPLQDKNQYDSSSYSHIDSFRRLVKCIEYPKDVVDNFPLCHDMARGWESGVVYIVNDLLVAARIIYPHETDYISKVMNELANFVYNKVQSENSKVYYSMSGSGASFFVIGNFMKEPLDVICKYFQKKYSKIQWKVFSVL